MPKWLEKKETTRSRSKKQESKIAKDLKGRTTLRELTLPFKPSPPNAPKRKPILYKVVGGCWECASDHHRHKFGYPLLWFEGRTTQMHRVVYTLLVGEIPSKMVVRHTCDNPSCLNPRHFVIGTYQDNSNDMKRSNRHLRGEKNPSAVLTDKQALEIVCSTLPTTKLLKKYKVSRSTILRVRTRKTFTHLKVPKNLPNYKEILWKRD